MLLSAARLCETLREWITAALQPGEEGGSLQQPLRAQHGC